MDCFCLLLDDDDDGDDDVGFCRLPFFPFLFIFTLLVSAINFPVELWNFILSIKNLIDNFSRFIAKKNSKIDLLKKLIISCKFNWKKVSIFHSFTVRINAKTFHSFYSYDDLGSTTTNSVREATFLNDLKVQNVKIQIAKEENPIDQRINLNRNISRDKIEGLNLRMADMFGVGSTNQFYCSPSVQNSFIEMKSLATPNNQSHLHSNNIVDNDLIDSGSSNILKNNIVHHNDNNLLNSINNSDPNLDPIDGIVSLLSAIYCKILVVIGKL